MELVMVYESDRFKQLLASISNWIFHPSPLDADGQALLAEYLPAENDFYLGHSEDYMIWTLAVSPWDIDESFEEHISMRQFCTAILIEPLEKDETTIWKILFLASMEYAKNGAYTNKRKSEIPLLISFPEYRAAGELLSDLPESWKDLPVEFSVEFTLSEYACVSRYMFDEYHRETFEEILKVVYSPRVEGILIGYRLLVRGLNPFLSWNADWALSRRVNPGHHKRKADDFTLIYIYQDLPSTGSYYCTIPYFGKPVVRMNVGGLTIEEAEKNWLRCAKPLRSIKRRILSACLD